MNIADLASTPAEPDLHADLVIIGGGPAGLSIARELAGSNLDVIVLESGAEEQDERFSGLNAVKADGTAWTDAQIDRRTAFHGDSPALWSHEDQPYGVRCRALGGSTHAWAGKSAAFDAMDFRARPWVANSGWPLRGDEVSPFVDRAADMLNLGPNRNGAEFWEEAGYDAPTPALDHETLEPYFWQFARSRIDPLDILRAGAEFTREAADNVQVFTNATVVRVNVNASGRTFESLDVATLEGGRRRVRARACVLAASAIENPRLLLASNVVQSKGLGNDHDVVGRYLIDHPSAVIGHFDREHINTVEKRFGFYGLRRDGRAHMYMHGLALSPAAQEDGGLTNAGLFMMPERAHDDPWDALKRLLQRNTDEPLTDIASVLKSPGLMALGLGRKALESALSPSWFTGAVVNAIIERTPNMAVREFQTRGVPHKLTRMEVAGVAEQPPEPENRITLSDAVDVHGVPLADVVWRVGEQPRRTLAALGHAMARTFKDAGLPDPVLEPWIVEDRLDDAVIIDMAHSMGTTRMADDPKRGVVDASLQVHGVNGLYIAGSSVFPTGGHANPTLMIIAMSIRLAEHLKAQLAKRAAA